MLELFRISGKKYLPQDPSGGAVSSEGRWHRRGQRVLYGSASLSTCVLELKVKGVPFKTIRDNHQYATIKVKHAGRSETVPDFLRKRLASL